LGKDWIYGFIRSEAGAFYKFGAAQRSAGTGFEPGRGISWPTRSPPQTKRGALLGAPSSGPSGPGCYFLPLSLLPETGLPCAGFAGALPDLAGFAAGLAPLDIAIFLSRECGAAHA